jgi:N-acetylmuramic acid 6-phosphate etherase
LNNQLFDEIQALATEQRNPVSMNLDELSTKEILELINREDAKVADAVREQIPHIEKVCDRLASTFGTNPAMVQGIIAGGKEAVFRSQEGAEDDEKKGALEVSLQRVSEKDMVIGIAASKRTPFVLGALRKAHELGSSTVLVTTNPKTEVDHEYLFESICPVVGPEVLMGSTRMKSAVAQKMVLTMITTTTMVLLGKVYENMMVDLQLTNQKLTERAKRIIMLATGCEYPRASELLTASGKHVKTAIVMYKKNVSADEAKKLVESADGFVKRAIH